MRLMKATKMGPQGEIALYGTTDGLRIGQGAEVDFDRVLSDHPRMTVEDALGPHANLFEPVAVALAPARSATMEPVINPPATRGKTADKE